MKVCLTEIKNAYGEVLYFFPDGVYWEDYYFGIFHQLLVEELGLA